jgi:ubiquitin-conjugating enzyme E2 D
MSNPRILKEIRDLAGTKSKAYSAQVVNDNVHKWKATIRGPADTPYDGGMFKLQIVLPSDYPFKAPKIRFNTKIYHCNISKTGDICLDILKDNWSPALTIEKVLLSIITLLECPNPEDPLEPSIAELMRTDGFKYLKNAKATTEKYAMNVEEEDEDESEYSDE